MLVVMFLPLLLKFQKKKQEVILEQQIVQNSSQPNRQWYQSMKKVNKSSKSQMKFQ